MKRWVIWSFDRGTFQYEVLCVLILAFIFLTPRALFNDRPDFMRLPVVQDIRSTSDNNGNTVFTVKVRASPLSEKQELEQVAVDRLKEFVDSPFIVSRMEPVYDTTGLLVAYSIWVVR